MSIGYFVPEFPSQTHAFFWREIEAMEASGEDVVLYSTRRPAREACPHAFAAAARARTHYVFPPRRGWRLMLSRPQRLIAAIGYILGLSEASAVEKMKLFPLIASAADLAVDCRDHGIRHVHIHSFATSAHIGALAHILDDLRYSLTLHGDLPVYGKDHAAKTARARFCASVTAPLLEQLREVYAGQTHLIPMGVDVGRFQPTEKRPAPPSALVAVTVARLTWTKGHRFFLQAMRQAIDEGVQIEYRIAGTGPYADDLKREVSELGLEAQVTFLGQIGEDAVLEQLQHADIFALTSIGKGEAAPVSVMEAMACGVPVICSRIGGTGDMIEDGMDGFLVDQKDVEAIAAAIIRLAGEPDLAPSMARAARESAVEKFSHIFRARQLATAIQSVARTGDIA